MAAEIHDDYLRMFYVYHRDEFIDSFGHIDERPDITLDEVVTEAVGLFKTPLEQGGIGELDLTIWRGQRLLAVIRAGRAGRPEIMRFDDTGSPPGHRRQRRM